MESKKERKALVVLSGGQDSTTCLFLAIKSFGADNVSAITFDYGQRHRTEIDAASRIAIIAGIQERHEIITVDGILVSTSPLVSDNTLDQYENHSQMEAEVGTRVEKTFVPMRNTLFLTIAYNRAVAQGCTHIFTGICQEDNANYPDCTEEFRGLFQQTALQSLGNGTGPDSYPVIVAPLMYASKRTTCEIAFTMPMCIAALAYSHTSYDGKYPPTDKNHANILRAEGFRQANLPDPLVVRAYRDGLMRLPETSNYLEQFKINNIINNIDEFEGVLYDI